MLFVFNMKPFEASHEVQLVIDVQVLQTGMQAKQLGDTKQYPALQEVQVVFEVHVAQPVVQLQQQFVAKY